MKNELFIYQENNRFFAQVSDGLEELATQELEALGARDLTPAFRGVRFSADLADLYRINYESRHITRVLAPIASFKCRDRNDLYRGGRGVDWKRLLSLDNTFGIFSTGANNPNLRNSKFAALCLKDAIADSFRDQTGKRPSVHKTLPDVWFNLHIEGPNATVNLDTSGGSLHRRGYRSRTVTAPLQEILAAAMVSLSGWSGDTPLHDPMCGSGTLLCEALIKAVNLPAAALRSRFGFRFLPDHDEALWTRVKRSSDNATKPLPHGLISGSDSDPKSIMAAHVNRRMLPGGESITVDRLDFRSHPGVKDGVILCNPPYGIRMGANGNLGNFYKEFGDYLKQRCTGSEAYIFFGNRELIKSIGLKPAWKKPVRNAGLDARIAKYTLY